MSNDKSEYLNKYLPKKSKVKCKVKFRKPKGLTIIDEDIDMKKIALKNNLDLYIEEDDVPLLVNVAVDNERGKDNLSKFTSQNWNTRHDSDSESENCKTINEDALLVNKEKLIRRTRSGSSSDVSPPHKNAKLTMNKTNDESDISPPRRHSNYDSDNSPPRKNSRFPDGQLKSKHEGLPGRRTEEVVVYRDKTGKKRDFEKERKEKELKEAKQKEKEEKYSQWGKGLKQMEMKEAHIAEVLHEVNKPLARYADDEDLDEKLKNVEREGDPMLEYVKKKKNKGSSNTSTRPVYKGPEPMPNRFNIRPGYRWDGVDRSNGFEKQFFLKQNDRKALVDMAYKWSTEDM